MYVPQQPGELMYQESRINSSLVEFNLHGSAIDGPMESQVDKGECECLV